MSNQPFEQIVDITEDYLGPAAKRFITRQVSAHLHKSPAEVSREDIPELLEWTSLTMALLTDDKQILSDYSAKMRRLYEARNGL